MELTARICLEDETYWANVVELPGVFASVQTLDELFEALAEGISMVLEDSEPTPTLRVASAVLTDSVPG